MLSLFNITGDDAEQFLQGQLTNDVSIGAERWIWSGMCNPKGRLLAIFRLWRNDQGFYLLVDSSLAETMISRLRMYVLRSKVAIQPVEVSISISDRSNNPTANAVDADGDLVYLNHSTWSLKVDFTGSEEVSVQEYRDHVINAGCAEIEQGTYEAFLPEQLNMDINGAVNFKKGCYTGQEIVARMHYLGEAKRRLYRCSIKSGGSSAAINAGDEFRSGDKVLGQVVNVGSNKLLLTLNIAATEKAVDGDLDFISGETSCTAPQRIEE